MVFVRNAIIKRIERKSSNARSWTTQIELKSVNRQFMLRTLSAHLESPFKIMQSYLPNNMEFVPCVVNLHVLDALNDFM